MDPLLIAAIVNLLIVGIKSGKLTEILDKVGESGQVPKADWDKLREDIIKFEETWL